MVSLSRTDCEMMSWIVPLSSFIFCMDFVVLAVCHKAHAAAATCETMAKHAKVQFCIRSGPALFDFQGKG